MASGFVYTEPKAWDSGFGGMWGVGKFPLGGGGEAHGVEVSETWSLLKANDLQIAGKSS